MNFLKFQMSGELQPTALGGSVDIAKKPFLGSTGLV